MSVSGEPFPRGRSYQLPPLGVDNHPPRRIRVGAAPQNRPDRTIQVILVLHAFACCSKSMKPSVYRYECIDTSGTCGG